MNTDIEYQFSAAARAAIEERRARYAAEVTPIHRRALRDDIAAAIPELTSRARANRDRDIALILAHLPPSVKALVLGSEPCAMPALRMAIPSEATSELVAA